jgi:hypothetical protein
MDRHWYIYPIFITVLIVCSLRCARENEEEMVHECLIDIDAIDFTFGMNYADTGRYLVPGEQSDLDAAYLEQVRNSVGDPEDSISFVQEVCRWVDTHFHFENAGGAMIGKVTVNELFESGKLYGCHSHALIVSSILRGFGFPAIMIETADVQWAYDYHDGIVDSFGGHVMSEIFVGGRWILLDNDGSYVWDYDPLDPYIPDHNHPTDAYFVFAKGLDTWDYSGKDESFTHDHMVFFSDNVYCFEEMFQSVDYTWQVYKSL